MEAIASYTTEYLLFVCIHDKKAFNEKQKKTENKMSNPFFRFGTQITAREHFSNGTSNTIC